MESKHNSNNNPKFKKKSHVILKLNRKPAHVYNPDAKKIEKETKTKIVFSYFTYKHISSVQCLTIYLMKRMCEKLKLVQIKFH